MPIRPNTIDIDQLIAALPRNEQVLVKRLRSLVTECIPKATEKAYDGVCMPFYTRSRLICFILPPSASMDKNTNSGKQKSKGVALGFNQGKLMSNEDGVLLAEGRKQVYVMHFREMSEIDENRVRALLYEAAMIDDQFSKRTKGKFD